MTNNTESFETSKTERPFIWLKNDLDFELVYKNGRTIISNDKKLKARFLVDSESKNKILKLGLSVISKKGNSVWRNRIKRILRESLIQNEEFLLGIANQTKTSLLIIFSPYSINQKGLKKIFLSDIKPPVLDLLNKIKKITAKT